MSKANGKRKASTVVVTTTPTVDKDGDESSGDTGMEDGIHTLAESTEIAKKVETEKQKAARERKNQRAKERRAEKAAAKKALADLAAVAAQPAEVKAVKAAEKLERQAKIAENLKLCELPTEEEIMGAEFIAQQKAKAAAKAAQKLPRFADGSSWSDKKVIDAAVRFCTELLDQGEEIVSDEAVGTGDALFDYRERLKTYVKGSPAVRQRLSRSLHSGHFSCDDIDLLCKWLMNMYANHAHIIALGLNKFESIGFVSGVLLQASLTAMMMARASCTAADAELFLKQNVRDEALMSSVEAQARQRATKRARTAFVDPTDDNDGDT
jgi:hypothetical protein